jgi:predicted phosphodiesterase
MAEADVLVCGHTHILPPHLTQRPQVINVGSVGKPKDGDPRAVMWFEADGRDLRLSSSASL